MRKTIQFLCSLSILFILGCHSSSLDLCRVYYPDGRIETGSADSHAMKSNENEDFDVTRISLRRNGTIQFLKGANATDQEFEQLLKEEAKKEKVVLLFANKNDNEQRILEIAELTKRNQVRLFQLGSTKDTNQ